MQPKWHSISATELLTCSPMTLTIQDPFDVEQLLTAACPTEEDTPFFNHCMKLAREQGLEWEQALEFTVGMRKPM